MRTIVVYQSSTGFTKQYAGWIAQECGCNAISIKQLPPQGLQGYDLVVFGGWVMGGLISGLDAVKKASPQHLIVFAVGATPAELVDPAAMKTQNGLNETPFFYLVGGFRFNQLNFMVKGMLKLLKSSVAKKENKTPQEQFMASALGTSFDSSDRAAIAPLVAAIQAAQEKL